MAETYRLINGKKESINQRTERLARERKETEAAEENAIQEKYAKRQQEQSKGLEASRKKGLEQGKELLANTQGYTPEAKQAMQHAAYSGINRQYQDYRRRLAAQQGAKGQYGGVAYAQNRDLMRMTAEQQSQALANIEQQDYEQSLRNAAALMATQQGYGGEYLANFQAQQQLMDAERERNRQRRSEEQFFNYMQKA